METEMETHEQKKDRLIMDRRNSKIGGDALEGTGMQRFDGLRQSGLSWCGP